MIRVGAVGIAGHFDHEVSPPVDVGVVLREAALRPVPDKGRAGMRAGPFRLVQLVALELVAEDKLSGLVSRRAAGGLRARGRSGEDRHKSAEQNRPEASRG